MAKEIKDRIAEILNRAFQVLDKSYKYNDEESGKANLQASGSRLIFPCYSKTYRNGERRISEQELRFSSNSLTSTVMKQVGMHTTPLRLLRNGNTVFPEKPNLIRLKEMMDSLQW